MLFEQFASLIRNQFAVMAATGKLFVSSVRGDDLWYLYLNSFDKEDNPVFRDPNSSTMNCNNDKHFIRRFGNIVTVDKNNNIVTIFDIDDDIVKNSAYYNSVIACRDELKKALISSVFTIDYNDLVQSPYERVNKKQDLYQIGHKLTNKIYTVDEANKFGVVSSGSVYTFPHFYAYLPKQYVHLDSSVSIGTHLSKINTDHEIFVKGLNIPADTLEVVIGLMDQGSLLRADIYKDKVVKFLFIKEEYDAIDGTKQQKSNWTWKKFSDVPFARFANELIGTTCIDLAQGKNINIVQKEFNTRVDPANLHKATAPISQRQIDDATKGLVAKGYKDSFNRRFAVLDDIDINQRIHTNIGTSNKSTNGPALFADVKPTANTTISRHKKSEFDAIEEVSIETFLDRILPKAKDVKVFLEGAFSNNLVTLTTAVDPNVKGIFKWDNHFSWTNKQGLASISKLTEAVVAKGGRVDGVFRFTHSWNELEPNNSLMDLHVFMPGNDGPRVKICDNYGSSTNRVGWNRREDPISGGVQDVDYVEAAPAGYVPVENITFPSLDRLKDGKYKCKIHNWRKRQTSGRGKAEIAFDGKLYEYIYPVTKHHEWVDIATVTLERGVWSIEHHLNPVNSNETLTSMWGLSTNQFHKVNLICLSPNYWGDNHIGNKHYMFLLDGCYSDEPIRPFHIENLKGELLEYRKVLEVFGNTSKLEPTKDQLAGLAFTDDSKESLIVKVEGSFKRTVRVKF